MQFPCALVIACAAAGLGWAGDPPRGGRISWERDVERGLREALDATLRLAQDTDDPERRERIRSILRRVREAPTRSDEQAGGEKR